MKLLLIVAIVLLAGCRTPPVACDAHLTPINAVTKPQAATEGKPNSAVQPAQRSTR
jgi:uncharacterized lipoprotein YajG